MNPQDLKIAEQYRDRIISESIKSELNLVDYYENRYPPENRQYIFTSPEQKAEQHRKQAAELRSAQIDGTPIEYLGIERASILNIIRAYAIDQRTIAHDYSDNKLIVGRALRRAVKAAHSLISLEPKLEIYSLKWLCTANPIFLQ